MISISRKTDVGTYEIWFNGSANGGGGKLEFSQSSRGHLYTEVNTKDWEHKLTDRNKDKLKELKNTHEKELENIVAKFHKDIEELLGKVKEDLEDLE